MTSAEMLLRIRPYFRKENRVASAVSMFKGICRTCILFLICLAASAAVAVDDASLVIRGARSWTGDPRLPWAEAVAIQGERILAVGNSQDIARFVGESTRVIDARGGMLTSGLIDSH